VTKRVYINYPDYLKAETYMAHLKTIWNGSRKGSGIITGDKMDTPFKVFL